MKSAVPDEPKEAAEDTVEAAKDSLPEPPKDIPNPLQNLFGELIGVILLCVLRLLNRTWYQTCRHTLYCDCMASPCCADTGSTDVYAQKRYLYLALPHAFERLFIA